VRGPKAQATHYNKRSEQFAQGYVCKDEGPSGRMKWKANETLVDFQKLILNMYFLSRLMQIWAQFPN
jgi:hypothetical protein